MSRIKLRVPGRYERPATHRAPLGDHVGEQAIRDQYAFANRGRVRSDRIAAELASRERLSAVAEAAEGIAIDERVRAELATVESAGTLQRPGEIAVREALGVAIAEQPGDGLTGRLVTVDVIKSGWNASGSRFYPADVLERDIPKIYGKGCQVFIDHPRLSEQDDIPERSLTTLAGVFEEAPWAVREADGSVTMRTTVRVFGPWQPLIREAWQSIGLSINGGGTGEYGEREGREGTIIESLTYGRSVDFVTVPGAGGRVIALMESHRPFESPQFRAALDQVVTRESGSLGAFVESRIHLGFTELGDELYGSGRVTRDERITLSGAIGDALDSFVRRLEADAPQLYTRGRYADPAPADGDEMIAEAEQIRTREASAEQSRIALNQALELAYGGKERATWVEDYDPDRGVVWFYAANEDEKGCVWQQSYITSDGTAVLTGARVQVRARTVYEPVTAPGAVDGPAATVATAEGRDVKTRMTADLAVYTAAMRTVTEATKTTAGGSPPADENGPASVPAITTKESDMGEKTADVVAREAAEARATTAELELARYRAGDAANPVINQLLAESDLTEPSKTKIRAEYTPVRLPLLESTRGLDEGALRTLVATSIKAEKAHEQALLEALGAGKVTGAGAATGAAGGAPAAYFTGGAPAAPEGGFLGLGFGGAAPVVMSEADRAEANRIREAQIAIYTERGLTREAAVLAVDSDN